MSLYAELIASLRLGWERVLSNSEMPGADGVSVPMFALRLERHLDELEEELRARTYEAGPLLAFDIPKPDGGSRRLAVPPVRDRLVQSAALMVLQPLFEKEFESISYAYRPGRSYKDAIDQLALLRDDGYTWVVDADIHAYFDEIDHQLLVERLELIVSDADLVALLRQWIMADMVYQGRRKKRKKGLPQGSVISPLLANLYLDELDEAFLKKGYKIVRFADDFVVLCKSQKRARKALELTDDLLDDLKLRLNEQKTRITTFEEGFRFLGSLFVRSLIVPSKTASKSTDAVKTNRADEREKRREPPEIEVQNTAMGRALFRALEEEGVSLADFVEAMDPPELADEPAGTGIQEEDAVKEAPAEMPAATHSFRRTLYIQEQGSWLRHVRERFVVTDGKNFNEPLLRIPAVKVDRIVILGHCMITPAALQHCLEAHIPITLLSSRGKYYGQIEGTTARDISRQRLQFLHSLDEPKRRRVAARIVGAKLYNLRSLLRRYARRQKDDQLVKAARRLTQQIRKLSDAENLDQLRGYEGAGSAIYFGVLGRIIQTSDLEFKTRSRRPPRDPVNALLSFGYTLLYYNVYSTIRLHRMNPYVGMLHAERSGHPALASDLIEEFRFVIDRLVIGLCNKRMFTEEDFTITDRGCFLTDEARKRFLAEFEGIMRKALWDKRTETRLSVRQVIDGQIRNYAAFLEGKEMYEPFLII